MIIVVLNPILVLTDWPLKHERFTFCPWQVGNKNWSSKVLRHRLSDIIINIRGQIENRPLQNTRSAGRKRLTAGC